MNVSSRHSDCIHESSISIDWRVLLNVQTRKTILSVGSGGDVFRFIEQGTQLVEIEDGVGNNESVTFAVRTVIEAGAIEYIKGHDRGFGNRGIMIIVIHMN